MSKGLNKVLIIGHLGQDPEIRHMPNGTAVANVSIATTESWKDKTTGEKKDKTEWHRVIFFARLAEIVGEYLRKGSQVYVEGKLQTRKWQDKNGQDRYTTEIVASEMQMLGGKGQGGERADSETTSAAATSDEGFDDDIPFIFLLPTVLGAALGAGQIISASGVIA